MDHKGCVNQDDGTGQLLLFLGCQTSGKKQHKISVFALVITTNKLKCSLYSFLK